MKPNKRKGTFEPNMSAQDIQSMKSALHTENLNMSDPSFYSDNLIDDYDEAPVKDQSKIK